MAREMPALQNKKPAERLRFSGPNLGSAGLSLVLSQVHTLADALCA
jgi:hypothetical protein